LLLRDKARQKCDLYLNHAQEAEAVRMGKRALKDENTPLPNYEAFANQILEKKDFSKDEMDIILLACEKSNEFRGKLKNNKGARDKMSQEQLQEFTRLLKFYNPPNPFENKPQSDSPEKKTEISFGEPLELD
jgi:hypothetical protein